MEVKVGIVSDGWRFTFSNRPRQAMAEPTKSSSSTYFTAAAVTVAVGVAAYAVYFDYKRRNDAEFRKKLSEAFTAPILEQFR